MKKDKFTGVCIGIIIFMGYVLMLVGKSKEIFITKGILQTETSSEQGTTNINWEKIYPFGASINTSSTKSAQGTFNKKDNVSQLEKYWKSWLYLWNKVNNLGQTWEKNIPRYTSLLEIGGYTKRLLEVNAPLNAKSVVRANNGYLYMINAKEDSAKYEKRTESYSVFNEYLCDHGIPFVYIQVPVKVCKYDEEFQQEYQDYTNRNIDVMLASLTDNQIDTIDLRDAIHKEGFDHNSLFFKTDHHWTIAAGLWAADEIANEINKNYGILTNIQILDNRNFEKITYKNAMFGSYGQTITHGWADSEDFDIYLPNFDTSLNVCIPKLAMNTVGAFEDTMINWDKLNQSVSAKGGYAFESYLYGNQPITQITNNNYTDGPTVLMIRDSFSLSVAPYLALTVHRLDLIDVRKGNGNFNGSIIKYIEKLKPDIVLILYSKMTELQL